MALIDLTYKVDVVDIQTASYWLTPSSNRMVDCQVLLHSGLSSIVKLAADYNDCSMGGGVDIG